MFVGLRHFIISKCPNDLADVSALSENERMFFEFFFHLLVAGVDELVLVFVNINNSGGTKTSQHIRYFYELCMSYLFMSNKHGSFGICFYEK